MTEASAAVMEETRTRRGAAIRGVGVVCPLGAGFREVSGAWIDGVSAALTPDAHAGPSACVTLDPTTFHDTPKTYLDRASALVLAAAALGLKDAASRPGASAASQPDGTAAPDTAASGTAAASGIAAANGMAVGTAYGCPASMLSFWDSVVQKGPRLANAIYFSHSYPNTPASLESIEHQVSGVHLTFCQGSASGGVALAEALTVLRNGSAGRMLAGGFDALPPTRWVPPGELPSILDPAVAAAPGEGAVVFLLGPAGEAEETVQLLGAGEASFLVEDGGAGAAGVQRAVERAMRKALADAGRSPEDVGLVVVSAAAPGPVDCGEAAAVAAVLGSGALATAAGGRMGHAPGAAAGYGVLAAMIALTEGWVVETGCDAGSAAAGLSLAVEPGEVETSLVLVNSIDRQGSCVCLAVGR